MRFSRDLTKAFVISMWSPCSQSNQEPIISSLDNSCVHDPSCNSKGIDVILNTFVQFCTEEEWSTLGKLFTTGVTFSSVIPSSMLPPATPLSFTSSFIFRRCSVLSLLAVNSGTFFLLPTQEKYLTALAIPFSAAYFPINALSSSV